MWVSFNGINRAVLCISNDNTMYNKYYLSHYMHVHACSEGRFLWQNAETLVREVVGDKFEACIPEISTYLVESIGNDTRIDYGSGKK